MSNGTGISKLFNQKNLDLNYLKNINCDWYDLKDSFTCYKVTR